MTKFLFTTLPTNDLGLLTRSLPVADELARRGHEIAFCSPSPAPSRLIDAAGFENLLPRHPIYDLMTLDRTPRSLLSFLASGKWKERHGSLPRLIGKLIPALPIRTAPDTARVWSMDHAAAIMGMLNLGFVRACCDAMKELMTECGARVVVDFWNPFAVIAARALDIPVLTIIQADAHPASRGFMWWEPAPENIPTVVPVVNQVLAGYGLPRISRLEELSVGDLTMVVGTPDTDPLPPNEAVTYLGAILWQDSRAQLPKKIADLSRDKPIIWVYSGNPRYSSGVNALDSFIVLQTCIGALAGEDVQVVLTTGHHPLPKEVLPLPANFHHEPYVPGLAMAEKCDLLIHHGGYGSCQTGLYAGKPAVIIPTYSERESNARRIAALGSGAVLAVDTSRREKSASVDELRNLVRRVLGDPSFSSNARRIGEKLRAYGGVAQAADLIEKFSCCAAAGIAAP